jgi:hypothetical protein
MRTRLSKTAKEASIDNPNTLLWSKISQNGVQNEAGFVHAASYANFLRECSSSLIQLSLARVLPARMLKYLLPVKVIDEPEETNALESGAIADCFGKSI